MNGDLYCGADPALYEAEEAGAQTRRAAATAVRTRRGKAA